MEFEQMMGILIIVGATVFGFIVGFFSRKYQYERSKYDGELNVLTNDDGSKTYSLDLNSELEILDTQKQVTFKINPS